MGRRGGASAREDARGRPTVGSHFLECAVGVMNEFDESLILMTILELLVSNVTRTGRVTVGIIRLLLSTFSILNAFFEEAIRPVSQQSFGELRTVGWVRGGWEGPGRLGGGGSPDAPADSSTIPPPRVSFVQEPRGVTDMTWELPPLRPPHRLGPQEWILVGDTAVHGSVGTLGPERQGPETERQQCTAGPCPRLSLGALCLEARL